MFKLNKKGEGDVLGMPPGFIIGVVIALFVIISLTVIIVNLYSIYGKEKREVDCINSDQWTSISKLLDNLDSSDSETVLFNNNDCKLASFTATQAIQNYEIKPDHALTNQPEICLCKVDSDLCKKYGCYKLNKFTEIQGPNGRQFTTSKYPDYIFLNFKRDGNILRIDSQGREKEPIAIAYKYNQQYSVLDEQHLVDEMNVLFKTNQIENYLPIVTIKENKDLPENVPNIESLTKKFTLDIVQKPLDGTDLNEYKKTAKVIDSSAINKALISFRISQLAYESIVENERNLILYYQDETNTWQSTPLVCSLVETNYLCGVYLSKFYTQFAISMEKKPTPIEKSLSDFINELGTQHSISPILIKSIIQAESRGDNKAVSSCGAAGIIQMTPATARAQGLNVKDYNFEWCPDEATTKCYLNGKKTKVSACNSCHKEACDFANDERFDEKKEIEAAVKYLVKIKKVLIEAKIEPSIANIAAAYNQGENAVIYCNCIPKGEAATYVSRVTKYYKQFSVEETKIAENEQGTQPT